jgi:hypothetical protein
MWKRVIWTDECSISTGGFGKVYVTRRAEEKYIDQCLVAKFRGYSSWIIHGNISGLAKGPLVCFEKEWGKINSKVYCDKVLACVNDFYQYMEHHPEVGSCGRFLWRIMPLSIRLIIQGSITSYMGWYGCSGLPTCLT